MLVLVGTEVKIDLRDFGVGLKRLNLDSPNVVYLGEFDFELDEPHRPSELRMLFDCSTWWARCRATQIPMGTMVGKRTPWIWKFRGLSKHDDGRERQPGGTARHVRCVLRTECNGIKPDGYMWNNRREMIDGN